MRTIKAKTKKIKETKVSCGKCKSKLAYTPSDIQHDREGKFVVCPNCKGFISVG